MIFPIRTEMVARRTPVANYTLLTINCLMFAVFNVAGIDGLVRFGQRHLILHGDWPALHQFFTYQFLHADAWHLAGNLLFLWVFGSSVNAKMGDVAYLLFYLGGGVFAATAFAAVNSQSLLGASGAIAAVTAAYLVLFPRSRVTVLVIFFFITTFEIPAMILIGVKVIVWDNIVAPRFGPEGNTAFSAHLGGYFFGVVTPWLMLWAKAIPRDQFDMLALIDRWNRRRAFRSAMAGPDARRRAEHGTVARVDALTPQQQQAESDRFDRITELRSKIAECLARNDTEAAAGLHEQLIAIDPNQCLPARLQVVIARTFYSAGKAPQAASAFERYLSSYRTGHESDEIRLLLGIIYTRDLQQHAAAQKHLAAALEHLDDDARIQQCRQWLTSVREALGGTTPDG